MAERKPSDDQAAFGVYPQLKRNRSKQDREAAKNVPVDLARGFVSGVLGAPGDIESLLRIPYDYLRAPTMSELVTGDKTSKTYIPTSSDIEKRVPFKSDTPVSRAATGVGGLAGGFYYGPGSPLKVIGALPSALKHGAEEFAKASVAGAPHVVKPVGGNWLTGSVEKALDPLLAKGMINNREIPYGPEFDVAIRKRIEDLRQQASQPDYKGGAGRVAEHLEKDLQNQRLNEVALNKWVQSNLSNYVKKQMATPEDPVRKLAEQGITHFPVAEDPIYWARKGESARQEFGGTQMAQSDLAKQWENRTDPMIVKETAQEHQDMMHLAPGMYSNKDEWIKKLAPETSLYSDKQNTFNRRDLGFDHILDVLRQDVAAGRIRPEQLNKVSMEQAVRRTHEFDQEMAKKMRETAIKQQEGFPIHKEYPEGYKWIELAPRTVDELKGVHADYVRKDFPDLEKTDPTKFANYVEDSMKSARNIDQQKLADALTYEGQTMGHCVGGYCPDVVAGNSRIFSLRDAKGEPHVTVEVNPVKKHPIGYGMSGGKNFPDDFRYERGSIAPEQHQQIYQRAKQLFNPELASDLSSHRMDVFQKAADEVLGKPADEIVQIKGKQNAAPKADYLPYVQDFVKSGKWSEVGDLKNTGLFKADPEELGMHIPNDIDLYNMPAKRSDMLMRAKQAGLFPEGQSYLTRDEWEGILRKQYQAEQQAEAARKAQMSKPFDDGDIGKFMGGLEPEMKAGGKVTLSNNPDTMMLDLQNKKQSGGSVKNKVKITDNKDAMWLATQDQKFGKGGKVTQMLTEGLEALGITKRGMEGVKQLSPEEKAVLEKWGQKQAQEAERAKKVEKMAKDSASKSPEDSVKPAKASTGKRTATPPDFYRKMAETQGDEAVLRAARAGKHLKPDTSGGYVGAPRTVDSPQALGKMRRELDQDFADSVEAVKLADPERLGTWYDRAKSGMAQMTEPYQLPRTLEQHGVYSAGVAPESELTFALKHLNSRNYGEPKMAYRGAGMRTLDRAVAADEPAEMGFKIGEYRDKNNPRLPNTGLFGVNDFRRAQGMGYTDPQGNPWKAGVSDTMHPFMDLETALQVDRANKGSMGGRSDWYGPHIQELPWVYGKAQDLYSRGASKTGRYGGDQLEGIKLALQDANKTAIDYAYKHAGSATHEAIPGASTGHVPSMINAPLDERIAYGNVGRWDRPSPEAALNEFPEVGAGNRDVIYSALGHRQLPTIEASGAYLPEGASAYEMQPVKIARPLLDFPTGGEGLIAPETKQLMDFSERFRALNDAQEAFGYNLPNTMGDVTGKNAAVLDTRRLNPNRNLDPATGVPPSADQMGALTAALGDSGYGIAPTSRGATIFPFDPNATTKDINKLLKSKREELQSIYPSEMEASLNSSGYGPGVGKYTPEGFTASEPFSGQATKGLLKEASYLPQSAVQNLSESEFVRQAIKEKMRRDAALPNAREDIQNTRKFFAEADWSKAVELIRKGMSPTAALAALGYSASSMAGEADR